MLYIFGVFLILSIINIKFQNLALIDEKALNQERTTMINGFFVGLILFSHFNSYISLTPSLTNNIYLKIFNEISQLMVVSFLFYSGYGIMESIKNKKEYIKNFFKKRIFKLFITFSIALFPYVVINLIFHNNYSILNIILAFIGITSIGNSNWFIFATFCMYFSILISFNIFKKNKLNSLLLCLIFSLIYILLLRFFINYDWWYNTILCFNFGMFFSYYKNNIINILKNNTNYILIGIITILVLFISRLHGYSFLMYEIYSLTFALLIILITFKVNIGNKVLYFLGKNTFNFYILQRISYIIYEKVGLLQLNIYYYFFASLITTIVLVIIFDKLINKVFKLIKL